MGVDNPLIFYENEKKTKTKTKENRNQNKNIGVRRDVNCFKLILSDKTRKPPK